MILDIQQLPRLHRFKFLGYRQSGAITVCFVVKNHFANNFYILADNFYDDLMGWTHV